MLANSTTKHRTEVLVLHHRNSKMQSLSESAFSRDPAKPFAKEVSGTDLLQSRSVRSVDQATGDRIHWSSPEINHRGRHRRTA